MHLVMSVCICLFQLLSLKWRRCQYNVEQSNGQHAAESELTWLCMFCQFSGERYKKWAERTSKRMSLIYNPKDNEPKSLTAPKKKMFFLPHTQAHTHTLLAPQNKLSPCIHRNATTVYSTTATKKMRNKKTNQSIYGMPKRSHLIIRARIH